MIIRQAVRMSRQYGNLLKLFMKDPKKHRHLLKNVFCNPANYLLAFPPQIFKQIWIPQIKTYGFFQATQRIYVSLSKFIESMVGDGSSELIALQQAVIRMTVPLVATYGLDLRDSQEILTRIKTLKAQWRLQGSVCGGLVAFFESKLQKSDQKLQALLSGMLQLFSTTESKVDYRYWAIQMLHRSVGEALFQIDEGLVQLQSTYRDFIQYNKKRMVYLLDKLKTRPVTFCAILSDLTLPTNNQDSQSHLKNMLLLLLIFEYWNRFKHEESKLKEGSVISILSQAFHRMMFLLYCNDQEISKAMIFFLGQAQIGRCKPIIQTIAYHFVALYKLYSSNDQKQLAKMIEALWKQAFTEAKINQIYLSFCPKFITQSQKITKSSLEECETKSIMSFSCKSSELSFITSQKKSRGKSLGNTTSSNLRKWITAIEKELKLFNLEKVYLLLDGLKAFFDSQNRLLQDNPKQSTLKLFTTIIKKIETKLKYRYNCQKLASAIYWQISCFSPIFYSKVFNYQAQIMGLGLFCLSSKADGYMNVEEILQFHEKYNYEENLHTVIHLKMLSQQINSHQNKNSLEFYEAMIKDGDFQGRLFKLFKKDFQGKNQDKSKLIIIAQLLSLKSSNITNNLLVNYVNYQFSLGTSEDKMAPVIKGLADLMNEEIKSRRDMDRVRLFLKMGTVFEEFYNRSREISAIKYQRLVPELYFHFLMDPYNTEYFYLYSKTYEELYYIKEAIFFLELHCYVYEDERKDEEIKKKAVKLYQQMSPAFSDSLRPIMKYLHIEMQQTEDNLALESHQLAMLVQNSIKGIEYNFTVLGESHNFVGQQPSFWYWLRFYKNILVLLIKKISEKAESNRIQQNFMMLDIVTNMMSVKVFEITQQSPSTRSLVTNLIKKIECLNNSEIRLTFLRVLISSFPSLLKEKQLQKCYLETLLKGGKYSQYQAYLQGKKKESNYNRTYLIYEVRVNFKQRKYPETLAKIRDFQELKTNQHSSEINQLQLECMYQTRLNFGIQCYLRNCNKAITKIGIKDDKDAYFSYYFKIFRKLFQAYNFIKSTDNQIFMKVYTNFLEASRVLTENKEYIPEAIFYWLRFLLQKFYFVGNNLKGEFYGKEMLDYFRGHSKQFVPFCTYLIKKISANQERNGAIITILTEILSENANECIWMISFLKNFDRGLSKKKSQPEDLELNFANLSSICQKIYQHLLKNNVLNEAHIHYIDKLVDFALQDTNQKNIRAQEFKKMEIPSNLPFVFLPDYDIDKIRQVRTLSQGKSAPLQMSLTLKSPKTQNFKLVNVIIKGISPSQYRMQSNAANFFAEIGLMDKDITYRIFHLTRSLVIIEHVENVGTINTLISNHFPRFRQIEMTEQYKYKKYLKQNNLNTRQTLNLFDNLLIVSKERVKISQVIIKLSKSISQWWERYTNFIRTHAHWSYIGYIVGLGDRHLDNILITEGFKLVHIDFQYILDFGFSLPYPQWVPFRLSHCLIEPLGVLGVFGLYYAEMIKIARQFRKNEVNVWKALSNITGVIEKNLTQDILNRSQFKNFQKQSIEDGIASLVECATNPYLLRGMFLGWTSYI